METMPIEDPKCGSRDRYIEGYHQRWRDYKLLRDYRSLM